MRKDNGKFTPTPNFGDEAKGQKENLPNSENFANLDEQLLVWGRVHLAPPEPPAGLFNRILLAIKHEQELRNTKRLAFGFLTLLVMSLTAAPFSWTLFANQIQDSGSLRFVEVALSDIGVFLTSWQEFSLAIAESLPVMAIIAFSINMILAVFTFRLFLYRKRLLIGYLLHAGHLA